MISVLVPVYNSEKYLKDCFDSLLSQTYRDFEVVVLNDGSTDVSLAIIEEYAKKDGRIKVFSKPNEKSVSKTRNRLLELITGEYFIFVDSDDTVDKKFLEILYTTAENTGSDITACGFDVIKRTPRAKKGRGVKTMGAKDALVRMCFGGKFYAVWNKLIRTEKLAGLRFVNKLNYGEDLIFFFDLLSTDCKFTFINNKLYHYKIRKGSLSTSKFGESKKAFLEEIIKMGKDCRYDYIKDILLPWAYCTAKLFLFYTRKQKKTETEYRAYLKQVVKDFKPYYKKSKYVSLLYRIGLTFLVSF